MLVLSSASFAPTVEEGGAVVGAPVLGAAVVAGVVGAEVVALLLDFDDDPQAAVSATTPKRTPTKNYCRPRLACSVVNMTASSSTEAKPPPSRLWCQSIHSR